MVSLFSVDSQFKNRENHNVIILIIVILILSDLILGKEYSITFLFLIVAYNPLIYRPFTYRITV